MSTGTEAIGQERTFARVHVPGWCWLGVWVYVLLLIGGSILLADSDTYWQIATGRWILEHHILPQADIYSFTKTGQPWISSSWLAQVLYAESYRLAGWAGPVILASLFISATFAQLAFILSRRIASTYAVLIALAALVLSALHFFARPHVLAWPFMIAWVSGLVSASERREAPGPLLLPLIIAWTNLHGGFVFGLALIAPFAFDALWNAEKSQRKALGLYWMGFGICAIAAACVTPYGWGSLLAAQKILGLGELLHLIHEWMPADFSRFGPFEACILASIAGVLYWGVRFTPPRIILVLGLLHMALSHVRNFEMLALLLPLVVVEPIASQFGLEADRKGTKGLPIASAAAFAAILGVFTWGWTTHHAYAPPHTQSPAAAVDVLKDRKVKRVLNDVPFGGYLIWREIPVFIDGRAELYGEQFDLAYFRAVQLKDVNLLLDMLKSYDIDAVLLTPDTPAAILLDHLSGWRRVYSDEAAVLHIRTAS